MKISISMAALAPIELQRRFLKKQVPIYQTNIMLRFFYHPGANNPFAALLRL